MTYATYQQIREKVERDLDLQDEIFIEPAEMLGYANEAIDEAEAEIHTIYEDYFLTSAPLALVTGTADYSLPSNIYANKIRSVMYVNGSTIFEIPRIRDMQKFKKLALGNQSPGTNDYSYILINASAAAGVQMKFVPPAQETSASNVILWYIRNAATMVDDTSVCDIPEFVQFVIQYMKVRCYEKEGHPNMGMAVAALDRQRKMMVETLTQMVPDNDNEIEQDMTHYEEMS